MGSSVFYTSLDTHFCIVPNAPVKRIAGPGVIAEKIGVAAKFGLVRIGGRLSISPNPTTFSLLISYVAPKIWSTIVYLRLFC